MHAQNLAELIIHNDVHQGHVIRAKVRLVIPLQGIVQSLQCMHYVVHIKLNSVSSITIKLLKHLGILPLSRLLLNESKDLFEHVLRVRSES